MPDKATMERARADRHHGKAATTQAAEFVRKEIEHIREGKHGARSAKQAIAIGLSKARRAGVKLPPPKNAAPSVRAKAAQDSARSASGRLALARKPSAKRSRAATRALKREGSQAASHAALSRQARSAARARKQR
jgi:hypothetical protein